MLGVRKGFTIVELLIVIVVIAILAAITVVAYTGVQDRAQQSKIDSDIGQLVKAIEGARSATGKTLYGVTGDSYPAGSCADDAPGTDFAALPKTDACWVRTDATLTDLYNATGIDVRGLSDPWGRPYFIDENEGVSGSCNRDKVGVYARPTNGGSRLYDIDLANSGNSGC